MNLRYLVRPVLYGGTAGVAVAAVGFALAARLSVSPYLTAVVFVFGGLTALALLLGTSSVNENSETPDPGLDGDDLLSAPTEAGPERRLTVVCFGITLALAGFVVSVGLG